MRHRAGPAPTVLPAFPAERLRRRRVLANSRSSRCSLPARLRSAPRRGNRRRDGRGPSPRSSVAKIESKGTAGARLYLIAPESFQQLPVAGEACRVVETLEGAGIGDADIDDIGTCVVLVRPRALAVLGVHVHPAIGGLLGVDTLAASDGPPALGHPVLSPFE